MKHKMMRGAFFVAAVLAGSLLNACSKSESSRPETPEEKAYNERIDKMNAQAHARRVPTTPVDMDCYNHERTTKYGIGGYAVEEVWYGQITKKFLGGRFACGGTLNLGYELPNKWQPHMKVLVRWIPPWSDDRSYTIERYTTIPYYKEPSTLHVHFFSKDRVRVIVSDYGSDDPAYPIHPDATEPPPEVDGELEQPPNKPNPLPPPKHVD